MHGDGEGKIFFAIESEEVGTNGEMSAAAHGQIFCETLDDTQDK